jgi:hypothetical protein
MVLNIDDDLVMKIVTQTLLEDLRLNRETSEELLSKEYLEPYESQDLAHQLRAIRHYEMVLSYYMNFSEYEQRVGKKFPE